MHHRDVKSASVHGGQSLPTQLATGALKWERRPFHLPPFSLSAPLLARVFGRERGRKGEGKECPLEAADRDGAVLIG